MTAGKASEPVIQRRSRITADSPRDEVDSFVDLITDPPNRAIKESRQIRVTSSQQIGPWLSYQVLRAVCDHESNSQREPEAHPCGIPLPDLAFPDLRTGSTLERRARYDRKAYDEGDNGWDDKADDYKQAC